MKTSNERPGQRGTIAIAANVNGIVLTLGGHAGPEPRCVIRVVESYALTDSYVGKRQSQDGARGHGCARQN
ncbi:hypothetical protein WP12_16710 [Sphingomonas sp. SRS2]|nr:hypothetical protein WP12_16710 [Sphingomonas sp. SRS2]